MAPKRPRDIEQETSSFSKSEDDNVSDFIIKPTVKESSDMMSVESESKKKKMKVNDMSIVLGLPVKVKKSALENKMNSKQSSESGFLTRKLFKAEKELGTKFTALDFEISSSLKGEMDGIWIEKFKEIDTKWRWWQQKMLELYIKKLELIGEETQLILDQLKSSN